MHARGLIINIHILTGILLVECLTLWGERERSRRQYRSQVSVFKPALFTEHSNTDKMKKRRTVADSVAKKLARAGIGIVTLALP